MTLRHAMLLHVEATLIAHRWHRRKARKALGISRWAIDAWVKRIRAHRLEQAHVASVQAAANARECA